MRSDTGNPYVRWSLIALMADAACFGGAALVVWLSPRTEIAPLTYWGLAAPGGILALVALAYCEAYRPEVLSSGRKTAYAVGLAMGLAFLSALGFYYLIPAPPDASRAMVGVATLFFPGVLLARAAQRLLATRPSFSERTLVVGASELGRAIAQVVTRRGHVELVGFLSDRDELDGESFEGFPILGRVHEVGKLASSLRIDRVVVASKDRDEFFPAEELFHLKAHGVRVDSGIEFYEQAMGQVYLESLRPSYLIFSEGFNLGFVGEGVKRACDLAIAAVALAVASPVLALAALAIRLDSPGAILYRQVRVGKGGKPFHVVKLRTMRQDAEADTGPVFASGGDARITRVGRLLRAARIDEIPQFWNILRGEMSVVGPRPERPEFADLLTSRYPYFRWRLCVKPGLTGWAQIRYGYVNDLESFQQKLSLDLFYLKHRTLAFDLFIMWETIKTALLLRGL